MKTKMQIASDDAGLSVSLCKVLQDRIVSGEIQPGARLVERHLCEEFGLSRTAVRETIIRLAGVGLVDITPDAGAAASRFDEATLLDSCLFREGVESIAAEQCATRMNREQAGRLEELAKRFEQQYEARTRSRPNQLSELDAAFHLAIIEGSGNALVKRAWDTAMLHFFRGIRRPLGELLKKEARVAIIDDHLAIARAIKDGNGPEAGQRMKEHIRRARSLIMQCLRENKSPSA